MDISKSVITDIALCGLEGTTLTGLWTILNRNEPPIVKDEDEDMKEFIWQQILKSAQVEFWYVDTKRKDKKKEQKSRNKVKTKSQEALDDPTEEDESTNENSKLPDSWVGDTENCIYGYCPNYEKRENVSLGVQEESPTYSNALSKWGDALFIVATKELRRRVLIGENVPLDLSLTPARYTFLEIIGKARERGFLQKDFRDFSMDPRTSFHHVKVLITMGLVTKQVFSLRREDPNSGHATQIRTNILFLKRFHRTVYQDNEIFCEKISEIMESEPGGIIEFNDLKAKITCSKKIFGVARRQLYSKGCIQYLQNGKVFNYKNGYENLNNKFHSASPLYLQLLKAFKKGEEDADEFEDDDVSKGDLSEPQFVRGIPFLQQAYWLIEGAEERGLSIDELGAVLCVPYHMARSFIRQLKRRGFLRIVTTDVAKQKVYRFISERFLHRSEQYKKISAELEKSADYREQTLAVTESNEKGPEQEGKTSKQVATQSTPVSESKVKKTESIDEKMATFEGDKGKSGTPLTVRGMRRQNKIFEKIRELKVIEGANQIYKAVLHSEQELGIKETVCRKSILRILNRLAETNMIKKYDVVIEEDGQSSKTFVYYCDVSVTTDDQIFQTAVNETRFRLKGIVENKMLKKTKVKAEYVADHNSKAPNNVSLLDFVTVEENPADGNETDTDDEAYEPLTGSGYQRPQYGYLPRFPRIRMLHLYIWHLVYGNEGGVPTTDIAASEEYGDSYYIGSFEWIANLKELPPNRQGKGYFQTGDVLAIMPLLVFTRCVGICARSNTLEKMLKHPTKRYTPLRDLPPRLKAKLFRIKTVGNYVGHFSESLILLAHMGLLYTTPEKLPSNRTQVVLFVSREAMLVDTTQSEKGYAKTRLPQGLKEFPKQLYKFDGISSICKYWKDIQYICLNTRLGLMRALRKNVEEPGGYVEKRPRVYRTSMTLRDFQEHFPTEDPASAPPKLYGDGLGAAGFDSTFFGHLPKNWAYTETKKKQIAMLNEKLLLAKHESRSVMPITDFPRRTASSVAAKANDGGRGKKRRRVFDNKVVNDGIPPKKGKQEESKEAKDAALKKFTVARLKQKAARLGKPKSKGHKCVKDDVDIAALKRKISARVSFSAQEDAAILMARVTAGILEIDLKKMNYWILARNIIHKEIPESNDKTTEALGRRSRYMLKNSFTEQNLKSCILECTSDPSFCLKKPGRHGDAWKVAFRDVYAKVKRRFQEKLTPMKLQHKLPETLEELQDNFIISKAFEQPSNPSAECKVPTSKDIGLGVLEQIVHNSLASQHLKEYVPTLVFDVFDRYPPNLLEEALISMKAKSLISRLRLRVPRRRALPISTMTYSLSVSYERIFEMPIAGNVFTAAKGFLRMLREGAKHVGRSAIGKHGASGMDKGKDDPARKDDYKLGSLQRISKDSERKEALNGSEKGSQNEMEEDIASSEPASSASAPLSPASEPGSLIYTKEESLGGHVACIFSLLACNKAFVEVEIPDDIVQFDPAASQNVAKDGGITSVTILKRKLYSENIEEALEIGKSLNDLEEDEDTDDEQEDAEEAMNAEDSVDVEETLDDDSGAIVSKHKSKEDSKGLADSESVDKQNSHDIASPNSKRPEDSMMKEGYLDSSLEQDGSSRPCGEVDAVPTSCSKNDNEALERSCLKASRKDATGNEETVVPKKKRKVTFEDIVKHGSGKKDHTSGRKNDPQCSVNFEVSTTSGMMSFLSDRLYMDRYKDSVNSKLCKVTSLYNYTDDRDCGAGKGSLSIVPTRSLEIGKTKMHTSRTTLMLHRSLEQESAQNRLVMSPDSFIINPTKVTCHLSLQPHSDEVFSFKRGHPASSASADGDKEQAKIQRFLKRKPTVNCNRDSEKYCDREAVNGFISLMKDHFSWNDNEAAFTKEVVKGIIESQEIGFTYQEVLSIYKEYQDLRPVEDIMDMLLNFRILVRVGMNVYRFVAAIYATEWCITTRLNVPKGPDHGTGMKENAGLAGAKEIAQEHNRMEVLGSGEEPFKGTPAGSSSQGTSNSDELKAEVSSTSEKGQGTVRNEIKGKKACSTESEPAKGGTKKGPSSETGAGPRTKKQRINVAKDVKDIASTKKRDKAESGHIGPLIVKHDSKKEEANNEKKKQKNEFWSNQVVCRPWFTLNSEYNPVVLRKFQRAILSLVMMCPGITESSIHGQFRTIMTRVAVKDILQFLEINGCVSRHLSAAKRKLRAFDPPVTSTELEFTDEPYFLPTANCVLNLTDSI